MAIKYYTPNGKPVYGPPYTKEEEANFYSRQGVSTMLRAKPVEPAEKPVVSTAGRNSKHSPRSSPKPSKSR